MDVEGVMIVEEGQAVESAKIGFLLLRGCFGPSGDGV